jgi:hypothetical protein
MSILIRLDRAVKCALRHRRSQAHDEVLSDVVVLALSFVAQRIEPVSVK